MSTGIYNITIQQGVPFNLFFTWKDSTGTVIPVTDYTAAMQVRDAKHSAGTIVDLASPADITLGGIAGTVSINISAAATGLLNFKEAVYDVVLTSQAGVPSRLLEGTATLSKRVTR